MRARTAKWIASASEFGRAAQHTAEQIVSQLNLRRNYSLKQDVLGHSTVSNEMSLSLSENSSIGVVIVVEDLGRYAKLSAVVGLRDHCISSIVDCDSLHEVVDEAAFATVRSGQFRRSRGLQWFTGAKADGVADKFVLDIEDAVRLFIDMENRYDRILSELLGPKGPQLILSNERLQKAIVACAVMLGKSFDELEPLAARVYLDDTPPFLLRPIIWGLRQIDPNTRGKSMDGNRVEDWQRFLEAVKRRYYS